MLPGKLLLIVHSLVTIGFAGALLFNTAEVVEYMGIVIASPDGMAELITMYIGMSCALAFFMLIGAFSRKWFHHALLLLVLSMSGIALARTLSFIFLEAGRYSRDALFYDIPMVILSWLAYKQFQNKNDDV